MNASSKSGAKAGRGCGSLFFGVFAVVGLIFFGIVCKVTWDTARQYFWKETDCTILTSTLNPVKQKYVLELSYRYEFGGREFTGTRIQESGNEFDSAREAQRVLLRYPGDSRAKCFVNPSAPEQSVLKRGSLWVAALVLFPLLFVAVGVGGIILIWRRHAPHPAAVSERAKAAGRGTMVLRILGAVFTAVGGLGLYFLTLRPLGEAHAAEKWTERPCVIVSSHVEAHRGSKGGTTYSLDIRYRYEVDGREYPGDRYNFDSGSSSGRGWRDEVARKYPPGTNAICFVNPDDPVDSVLVREVGAVVWFGIIPGLFLIAGLAFIVGAGRAGRARRMVPANEGSLRTNAPARLKAAGTPLAGCIGIGIFAAIWNGVIWGVLLGANLSTGAKVVLGLFALVGLGMIVAAIHQFLALFNPKPELTARSGAVPLGGTVEVDFRLTGSVKRIARLRITLEGRESATYRRGTNTVTDKSVFAEMPLLETGDHTAMSSGTLRAVIPVGLMHSFDSPNNKIVWSLHVRGEIPKWPDIDAEYPITVLPAGRGG